MSSIAAAGWCPIDKGTTWLGHNSFWRSGRRKSSYFACRVSAMAQPLRRAKKWQLLLPYICWASSTLHLRITSNFSPSVYYIYNDPPPPYLHTLGKYAILYYVHTLVHVCELLKGTHHNTQRPRNHVGVAGKCTATGTIAAFLVAHLQIWCLFASLLQKKIF